MNVDRRRSFQEGGMPTLFKAYAAAVGISLAVGAAGLAAHHRMANAEVQDPNYCAYVPGECSENAETGRLEAPEPISLRERVGRVFGNDNQSMDEPTVTFYDGKNPNNYGGPAQQ